MALERRLVIELVDNVIAPVIHPQANLTSRDGTRIHIQFDPHQISAADLIAHATSQNQVQDLFVENPPIEETIARIYEDRAT